jgi:hypothetical protein
MRIAVGIPHAFLLEAGSGRRHGKQQKEYPAVRLIAPAGQAR